MSCGEGDVEGCWEGLAWVDGKMLEECAPLFRLSTVNSYSGWRGTQLVGGLMLKLEMRRKNLGAGHC